VVLALQSGQSWSRFNEYYAAPDQAPTPAQLPEVLALRDRATNQRTWAYVAFGAAVATGACSR
jgi:hypothetical protein